MDLSVYGSLSRGTREDQQSRARPLETHQKACIRCLSIVFWEESLGSIALLLVAWSFCARLAVFRDFQSDFQTKFDSVEIPKPRSLIFVAYPFLVKDSHKDDELRVEEHPHRCVETFLWIGRVDTFCCISRVFPALSCVIN